MVGPLFETGEYAHNLRNTEQNARVSYINGAMDCYVTAKYSKLRATHIIGTVGVDLAGLDSYVSA